MWVELPLYCFGIAVVLVIIVPGLVEKANWGVEDFLAALGIVAILGLIMSFLWMDFVQLSASLTVDVLRLPFYLPPPLRTRRRTVSLSEIRDVVPALDGVDVHMKNGTRFFLDRRYFGTSGTEVVVRLSARFGRSYAEAVEEAIEKELNPVTLEATSVRGTTLHLSRPLFSYSGTNVTRLRPADVVGARFLTTATGTSGYRMELADGSPFFVSEAVFDRLGLRSHPEWAAKLPQISGST